MKKVSFEKALKYSTKDVVVKSDFLKEFCNVKKNKSHKNYGRLSTIADELPMGMKKINEVIKDSFDEITYIEIMSKSKFYILERSDYDYNSCMWEM